MLIIYALIFWVAYAGFIRVIFDMLQEDGAFNILSKGKLQAWKDKLYGSDKPFDKALELVFGGCGKCTAFWWSFLWLSVYVMFTHAVHTPWFDSYFANSIWATVFLFITFYSGFISLNRGV